MELGLAIRPFFLHFVFSFMGEFLMNEPINRCFLTFPCICPEKKKNSEFGQISNTNILGTENKYQHAIFARIPNYL